MIDTTFFNAIKKSYQIEDSETSFQELNSYAIIEIFWDGPDYMEFFIPEQELKDIEVSIKDALEQLEIEREYSYEVENFLEADEPGAIVTIEKLRLDA